jgi:hypothetical protein
MRSAGAALKATHRWGLTQHVRDVPRDELERAAIAAFSHTRS